MKLRYKILIGTTGFFVASLCFRGLSGGFDAQELTPPTSSDTIWDTSQENMFDIESLLTQQFHYLGKGNQAFAFTSDDGKYVLKLFKPHYPMIASLKFTYIPLSKWVYRTLFNKEFKKRNERDFTSYLNAYRLFKDESLVEYLHLTKTSHLKSPLKIFDKINMLRTLDPNETCFLIQRKVDPIEDTIHRLLKEGKKEEAKLVLEKLVHLLLRRIELRFHRPSNKYRANFGCVGLEPIQLDIGKLLTPEDFGLPSSTTITDFSACIEKLRMWVKDQFPALQDALEELILMNNPKN